MAKKKFSLGVAISLSDKLTAPLNKAQEKMKKFGSFVDNQKSKLDFSKKKMGIPALQKSFGDLGSSLKPVGIAFGAMAVAGVAAFALIKDSAGKLTALDDFSKTVGMNVESVQELRYAAQQMGSSAEEMDAGLKTFTEGMGKARAGSGKLLGFLNKINPAFAEQLMATTSNEEGFEVMMRAMEKVVDPQKKLALATMAFGSAGEGLARVSGEGAEKMKLMREEARKFGLASQEDAEAAGSFEDGMHKVIFALDAAKNKIAVAVMPVLSELFQKLTKWIAENQVTIQAFAQQLAVNIPKAVNFCTTAFKSIIDSPLIGALTWMVEKLGAGNLAFVALGVAVASVALPAIASLITICTSLAGVASALGFTFAGAWAALLGPVGIVIGAIVAVGAAGFAIYKYWDEICDVFSKAWGWIKKIASAGLDKIAGLFGGGSSKHEIKNVNSNERTTRNIIEGNNLGASTVGADMAGRDYFESSKSKSETDIKVSFDNLPKGARVQSEQPQNANLDLSMGYSMVSPL